jgi:NAD(P)-dependent dehydrogenase (short-subunit alcohol dehydrogenase family)
MGSSTAGMSGENQRGFVLITGTSSGIGRACAVRLAREGFSVLATVRTDADAHSVEAAGSDTPLGIRAVQLDVADANSIQKAAARVGELVGNDGLYGLVNNAGICVVGPAECISLDDWRYQFEVNFFGVIALTQAMLPLLRLHNAADRPKAARIVNISSITGEIATPLFGAYSASKFALRALSDSLRLELQGHGIHVSAIVPGTIQSEIWRKEKEGIEAIRADSPARRLYGRLIDNVSDYVFKCAGKAIPADRVAEVVSRCLTSRRPRPRYLVGWEAGIGSRARKLLPDRLFDYLLGRTMGVPGPSPMPAETEEVADLTTVAGAPDRD